DDQGKLDEAIVEYREAIRLDPGYAEAHCNLGSVLQRQGRLREALREYRKGHGLGRGRANWRYPSAEWVRQAERLVALEARLPAMIPGEDQPMNAAEGVPLAGVAYRLRRHGATAPLFAQALHPDPKQAGDLRAQRRYSAACAAALAGAGRGEDA